MLFSYKPDYRLVKIVAGYFYGLADNSSAQRYYRYICCSASDIYNHASACPRNVYSRAYGGRHRFFYKHNISCACLAYGVFNRSLFNFRNTTRYANRYGRFYKRFSYKCFINKIFYHFFRQLIIGNNSLFQRSDSRNVSRRSAEHTPCLFAYGKYRICIPVNGNNRRFF